MYYVQLMLEYDASVAGVSNVGENVMISAGDTQFDSTDANNSMDVNEMFYSSNPEEMPSAIDW